jgi:hypothetical protein
MFKLNVKDNFPDIAARLQELGRQAPFVAALSLTRTIQDVQKAEKAEMQRAFDRPTAFALNSTFIKPASKSNLEARLWVKDRASGTAIPADRVLLPEIYGGGRGQKGMDRMLQRAGLMPTGWFAVPAAGARLDANGNVQRSQIAQVLAALSVQRSAQAPGRGKARTARAVRQGETYFALARARRGLKPGIYLKRQLAHGSTIKPVFIFVSSVHYRPRPKFFEVGQATARARFPVHFNDAVAKAIATARLR